MKQSSFRLGDEGEDPSTGASAGPSGPPPGWLACQAPTAPGYSSTASPQTTPRPPLRVLLDDLDDATLTHAFGDRVQVTIRRRGPPRIDQDDGERDE